MATHLYVRPQGVQVGPHLKTSIRAVLSFPGQKVSNLQDLARFFGIVVLPSESIHFQAQNTVPQILDFLQIIFSALQSAMTVR